MPYPGGKHGSGHYIPAGGGSFSNPPIVLRDQVLSMTNPIGSTNRIKFGAANFELVTRFDDNSVGPVLTLPLQWNVTTPVGGVVLWSVRELTNLGPDGWSMQPTPIGDWFNITTSPQWLIPTAPSGQTRENTSIFEIAATADLGTILARATITVRHIRP